MRPIDQIADLLDELLLKAGPFAFLVQGLAVSSSGWADPELEFYQEQVLLSPNAIAKKNGRDNFTDDELLELVSLLQTAPYKVELLVPLFAQTGPFL